MPEKTQLCVGSSISFGLLALTVLCGMKDITGIFPSMPDCKGSCLPFPLGGIPKDGLAIKSCLRISVVMPQVSSIGKVLMALGFCL